MNQTGEETYIADSFFSSGYDDNAYVGYMYGTPNSTTYEETHANVNESVVKKMLENWYHDNLLDYNDDIEERVGFCGDRTPSTASSSINYLGGTGKTHTYYRGFIDLYVNYTPTLKCANVNDYYTTGNNVNGNKTLIYPIGLITADELVYAGGKLSVGNENTNFYLYTGHDYWTMTPFAFYSFTGYSYDFILTATGFINNGYPFSESVGVRPVINLKANTMISGTGTMNDPYKVVG